MRQSGPCFARTCCGVVVQEHDLRATPAQCNSKRALSSHFKVHASHPALHTSHLHFTLHTSSHLKSRELFSPHLTSSQLFSSHPISSHMSSKPSSSQLFSSHPSTDQPFSSPRSSSQLISAVLHARKLLLSERSLFHKKPLGAESFCTPKLRHRCIHTEKPLQNTLCYKACTRHFPVLRCTTKLATSTSQNHFVLQSLHKALPSTTKLAQVLLCTTQVAQALPSTLRTKLLHINEFLYTASFYTGTLLHRQVFTHREGFTHRKLYTQQVFTQRKFLYTQRKLLAFTQRSFYTKKASAFHKSFRAQVKKGAPCCVGQGLLRKSL